MNPAYPSYPQVPGQGYPPTSAKSPYPPSTTASNQPQPGFTSAPYPTNPYPPNPSYPQSTAPYPPQNPGLPYPTQPSGYSQPSSYPPQPASYSYQASSYPTQSPYPPAQQTSYNPQQLSYPPQPQTSYPAQQKPSYPLQHQQQPSYPSQQPSYSTQSTYPSQSVSYQQNLSSTYPTSASSYPSGQHHSSVPSYSTQQGNFNQLGNPSVRPYAQFDARQDAEVLRKAMKGFGTDEKAIINVLTRRSNAQRLEIAVQFKALYGKDLISDLKSELGGNFERVIISLVTPIYEFLAKELHEAISGIGTEENTLVEILCTAGNSQIYAIKDAYQRLYYRSLENDLISDTSGNFKRLLVSLCQGRRTETPVVDESLAVRDAQALYQAGELILGTDESTFNAILVTRSYAQLQRTFIEYQRVSGRTFEQAVRSEFSGDIKDGLLAIVKTVEDRAGFFAERLRNAMVGMGTNDNDLIRIVVSRCEVDMLDIKRAYQQRYSKSLESAIEGETSGDYKKALLSLIAG